MQIRWILIGLVLTGMGTGCYELREGMNDWTMSTKTHFQARHAWHRLEPYYEELPHCGHFKDGFVEGYCAVACGGTGCQPTLPPRDYWSVWYQNPEGQQMQHAWFDGYSHGALAAQQDNVPVWNQLVISNQARTQLASDGAEHHISIEGGDAMPVPPPAPAAEDAAQWQTPSLIPPSDVTPATHQAGPALPFTNPTQAAMPASGPNGLPSSAASPAAEPQTNDAFPAGHLPQEPNVYPQMPQSVGTPMPGLPSHDPQNHHHVARPSVKEKFLKAIKPVTHDYNPEADSAAP